MEVSVSVFLLAVALGQTPPVANEMHERFQAVTRIREHLIQGELAPAKLLAKDLTDAKPLEGTPKGWVPFMESMSNAAVGLEAATDMEGATMALARVSSACADCHVAHDGGPGLGRMRSIPPQKWSEGENMPLHLWAVDWMWLGLVAPSEEAWERGTGELRAVPLAKMFEGGNPAAELLEAQVYALAKEGALMGEERRGERTAIMGKMLATCAACHALRDAGTVKAPATPSP